MFQNFSKCIFFLRLMNTLVLYEKVGIAIIVVTAEGNLQPSCQQLVIWKDFTCLWDTWNVKIVPTRLYDGNAILPIRSQRVAGEAFVKT